MGGKGGEKEGGTDKAREIEFAWRVEVRWEDVRRGGG